MTIKELEEAYKVAKSQHDEALRNYQILQEQESSLESEATELWNKLDELRDGDLNDAFWAWKVAGEKCDALMSEHHKRTKGLEGAKLPNPAPMLCG